MQKSILDWLEYQKDCLVVRFSAIGVPLPDGGFRPLRRKGVSDLLVCCRGQFLAIECKREIGGRVSEEQKRFLHDVTVAGGSAMIARRLEDVIERINLLRKTL